MRWMNNNNSKNNNTNNNSNNNNNNIHNNKNNINSNANKNNNNNSHLFYCAIFYYLHLKIVSLQVVVVSHHLLCVPLVSGDGQGALSSRGHYRKLW